MCLSRKLIIMMRERAIVHLSRCISHHPRYAGIAKNQDFRTVVVLDSEIELCRLLLAQTPKTKSFVLKVCP